MQRRLCEMSEAKWSITEAKCLQISYNKYASQRDAISYSMGNLMLSHSAGMHNTDKSIAGMQKRFHFASLHYIFSAYLPTHIKFLTEFHRIFFGTTCISFPKQKHKKQPWGKVECFAFGGRIVRFASLETSFHAANHTIPPPPSYEGLPLCPKDKNRSPFHGEKPLMIK